VERSSPTPGNARLFGCSTTSLSAPAAIVMS
jgi:hypothetical protein